jgi:hypothetical protein
MPPLSGLGFDDPFCVFPQWAGYGAAEAAPFQDRMGGSQRWKCCADRNPRLSAAGKNLSGRVARSHTGCLDPMAKGRERYCTDQGCRARGKASAVPPGLGSSFVSLPRTYVRGCTVPPLSGLGVGDPFCVFPRWAGYGAAEAALSKQSALIAALEALRHPALSFRPTPAALKQRLLLETDVV